jgi:GNAT superfamily N-acetyltransferase
VTASAFTLRDARPGDEDIIARFVRELAEYEKLPHEARATGEDLYRALFNTPPRAHALIVEAGADPVGFALWFYNFSTFTGRPGLYLEDLYVVPAWRGRGIGRAVFRFLARRAIVENCGRMEWWVLDWNTPAIEFYRSMGAQPMDDWTVQRLSGEALAAIAG